MAKANRHKRELALAKSQVRQNHALILLDQNDDAPMDFCWINHKRFTYLKIHPNTHHRVVHTPMPWHVVIASMSTSQTGETYLKSIEVSVSEPYTFKELIEPIQPHFIDFVKGLNDNHDNRIYRLHSPYPFDTAESKLFSLIAEYEAGKSAYIEAKRA